MKNSFKLLAGLAILGLAGTASAQNTATASGTANVNVVSAISITAGHSLDFGNIVSGSTGGSVTVDQDGNRSSTGDVDPGHQTGNVSAATFTVTGEPDFTFAYASSSVGTSLPSGLALGSLTGADGNDGVLTLGTATLTVGGTLTVSSGYTGHGNVSTNWTETVNYN